MAIWKLSLPLFSAKPPGLGSIPRLHFIAAVRLRTHQYAVVCETGKVETKSFSVRLRSRQTAGSERWTRGVLGDPPDAG